MITPRKATASLKSPHGNTMTGRQWEAMRLRLYWAYEGTPAVPATPKRDPETHFTVDTQTAWYLRRGSVELIWRDQPFVLHAGQWAIFGIGRGPHRFSLDAELLSICFRAEWHTGQALFDDTDPIVFQADEGSRLNKAAGQLIKAASKLAPEAKNRLLLAESTFGAYLQVRRAYFGWLDALARCLVEQGVAMREVFPDDERVSEAMRVLDEWPLHKPFTEAEAASAMGMSRPHFSRVFVAALGLTPKSYFDERRLRTAREQLITEDLPIKTIAYQLGFHDAAHFSHWFAKRTKVSPGRFRKGKASSWVLA